MKYRLLFIITISLNTIAIAQVEFAPVGAKWTMDRIVFTTPTFFQIQPRVMECTGTEIIQDKVCKKIEGDFFCGSPGGLPVYLYQEEGKVFFYSIATEQFELLYNFDALPGESWVTTGYEIEDYFLWGNALTITVLSLDEMIIDGDTLTVQNVSFNIDGNTIIYDWGIKFIEKIGSLRGMFPRYGLCDEPDLTLRCYEDPESEYHLPLDSSYFSLDFEIQYDPLYSCSADFQIIFTSQDEVTEIQLSVYPNSFIVTLHILLPPEVASKSCLIRISDTAGRVLITQDTKGKEDVVISTEKLPGGMYIVTVEAEGYRGVEKVVKIN